MSNKGLKQKILTEGSQVKKLVLFFSPAQKESIQDTG
jgi:hypothetical protein